MMDNLLDRMAAMENRQLATERRLALWRGAAVVTITIALVLLSLRGVTAQGGGSQNSLAQRVAALETTVASQGNQIAALQTTTANQANQISTLQTTLNNEIAARQAGETNLQNQITNIQLIPGPQGPQGPQGPVGPQGPAGPGFTQDQVNDLAELRVIFLDANNVNGQPFFHREHDDIYITGANLHLVNGLGATNGDPADPQNSQTAVVNGLGNLIVGYNELRGDGTDSRNGSHNLVVGQLNNFSSYGGLLAGFQCEISAALACVSGGVENVASGVGGSVSGGFKNVASGGESSVSGGSANRATAGFASISGGSGNTAGGVASSVSGGHSVSATDTSSWAAGTLHSP